MIEFAFGAEGQMVRVASLLRGYGYTFKKDWEWRLQNQPGGDPATFYVVVCKNAEVYTLLKLHFGEYER